MKGRSRTCEQATMGQNGSVRLLEKIGEGSYGEVYKAKWEGQLVAAKRLHPILFRFDPGGKDGVVARFLDECRLLRELRHPNIVELLHVVHEQGNPPILITELLDCDLAALVEKSQSDPKVATEDVLNIMFDVAKGLEYLHGHKRPIIHRDIAPKNILLDSKRRAKITDVGLAKLASEYQSPVPGTQAYMAPETYVVTNSVSQQARYGIEIDIYSLGVTMLEIIIGHPPRMLENPLTDDIGEKFFRCMCLHCVPAFVYTCFCVMEITFVLQLFLANLYDSFVSRKVMPLSNLKSKCIYNVCTGLIPPLLFCRKMERNSLYVN